MKAGKMERYRQVAALRSKARRLRFSRRVDYALKRLPIKVQAFLDNIAIVVEEEPGEPFGVDNNGCTEELFGLYHGVPRIERFGGDSMTVPDQISIYRGPLERAFGTGPDLDDQIRVTILHEVGHHLGLDEARLEELGLA